jgi:copper ion binding protein
MKDSSSLELPSLVRRGRDTDDIEIGMDEVGDVVSAVDIGVGGMTCSMCSSAIHKALSSLDGVVEVTVSLATNVAHVEYIESDTLTPRLIADEIEDIGYDVTDVIEKVKSKRTLKIVELAVGGMTCSMCSSAVSKALTGMAAVESVDVSLSTNIARIKYYDDALVKRQNDELLNRPDDFREMIEDIGYDVNDVVDDSSMKFVMTITAFASTILPSTSRKIDCNAFCDNKIPNSRLEEMRFCGVLSELYPF